MQQHPLFAEPQAPNVSPRPTRTDTALPSVTLLQGDCLEVMPTLAAGSVAMVFADLPYGMTKNKWDKPKIFNLAVFWNGIRHIKTLRCNVVLSATNPFAADLIASNRREFRYDLVWQKSRATGFLNAGGMPLRAHELLCCFYARPPTYNAQKTLFGATHSAPRLRGKLGTNYWPPVKKNIAWVCDGTRHPISVIPVASTGGKQQLHPTQKPVALLEWLIRTYTNPGDLVLDPTAGSGVTAIACLNTGRRCIAIEKDATYFEVMSKRVAEHKAKLMAQA